VLWSAIGMAVGAVVLHTTLGLKRPFDRTYLSFACIMGVTAILIHSWVDFNLQIPANAALFMILLALGWISISLDRREGAARTRSEEE